MKSVFAAARAVWLVVLWLVLQSVLLQAQTSWINVNDPRDTRTSGDNATLEEATLVVRPQGIYMQCSMFLTYSARSTAWTGKTDSLEIRHWFSLPAGSIVTDSWLWVGDSVMQGKMFDRSTATQIYENIVRRIRKDPSLLVKNGTDTYNLSIFPMRGNETRRVNINYLVPVQWSPASALIPLPIEMLRGTKTPLKTLTLVFPTSQEWSAPRVLEREDVSFTAGTKTPSADLTGFLKADIALTPQMPPLTLSTNSPMRDGVLFSTAQVNGEQYYQCAMLPSIMLGRASQGRKVTFLVDFTEPPPASPAQSSIYVDANSVSFNELLTRLQSLLLTNFTARDSFNLHIASIRGYKASQTWVAGDERSIRATFTALGNAGVKTYPNLPTLLREGFELSRANAGATASNHVILVANTKDVSSTATADEILKTSWRPSSTAPRVHVVDFSNNPFYHRTFVTASGNEYLYTNLAQLSGGSYQRVQYTTLTLDEAMRRAVQGLNGIAQAFDANIQVANGFAFGRYSANALNTQGTLADRVFTQTGKFTGSAPFNVQLFAIFDNKPISTQASIAASIINAGNWTTGQVWVGNHLAALERNYYYGTGIGPVKDIIDLSLKNRVLSTYTAFLALEPNDTIRACRDCALTNVPSPFAMGLPASLNPSSSLGVTQPSSGGGGGSTGIGVTSPAAPTFVDARFIDARWAYSYYYGGYQPFVGLNGATAFMDATGNGFWVTRPLTTTEIHTTTQQAPRLSAAPMPFTNSVTFTIETPTTVASRTEGTAAVYTMLGERVKSWPTMLLPNYTKLNIVWDGANESGATMPAGAYMLVVQVGGERYSLGVTKAE